jgi:hypothetical protein
VTKVTLWLRNLILGWLGISDHQARLLDLERHFVTKRDAEGAPVETLADVPVSRRQELKQPRTAGLSWPQRRAVLEATDGGTRAAIPQRMESTS